jgi:hypothetical protein
MGAGRPQIAHPGELWAFAEQFYWDFRRLAEGLVISRVDEDEYKRLVDEIDKADVKLDQGQLIALAKVCTERAEREGIRPEDRASLLREAKRDNIGATRHFLHFRAGEEARRQVRIPGKPEIVEMLLEAKTSDQVKSICEDAFTTRVVETPSGTKREVMWPNWPISIGSVLPMYLSQYAAQFVAAKNDQRFPHSDRPSTRLKQFWFLSRSLSGALHGVEVRTAINLVGSKRPEEIFDESRAAKPSRRRAKKHDRGIRT